MESLSRDLERINDKLDGLRSIKRDVEEIRRDVASIWQRISESVKGQHDVQLHRSSSNGDTRSGYDQYSGTVEDPRNNRAPEKSSFISVGSVLRNAIDKHNSDAQERGNTVIKQIDRSAQSFTRIAMKTTEVLLGASSVFGQHLGLHTLQEIQSIHSNDLSKFLKEYNDISRRLVKTYPVLRLAYGGWAVREIIRGKLISIKEKTRKENIWSDNFHGSTFDPSTCVEVDSDDQTASDIIDECCAVHPVDVICNECEQIDDVEIPEHIRLARDGNCRQPGRSSAKRAKRETVSRYKADKHGSVMKKTKGRLKLRTGTSRHSTTRPIVRQRREVPWLNSDDDNRGERDSESNSDEEESDHELLPKRRRSTRNTRL